MTARTGEDDAHGCLRGRDGKQRLGLVPVPGLVDEEMRGLVVPALHVHQRGREAERREHETIPRARRGYLESTRRRCVCVCGEREREEVVSDTVYGLRLDWVHTDTSQAYND